jgi:hypothetical protein
MPIETANFINELDVANPLGSDDRSTADDHLRLVKGALKGSFPNFTGIPMTATEAQLNAAGSPLIFAPPVTSGAADTYTATVGITAYVTGTIYKLRIHAANTAAVPTLALDGLAAINIAMVGGANLLAGELYLDFIAELYYTGTFFALLNPPELSGTVTSSLTTDDTGTITLSSIFDTLAYAVRGRYCTVSGRIQVLTVSVPVGQVELQGLPFVDAILLEASDESTSDVLYTGLSASVASGVALRWASTATPIIVEKSTTTFLSNSMTGKLQSGTAFIINHTYPVR